MSCCRRSSWLAGVILVGSGCVGTVLRADDKPNPELKSESKAEVRVIAVASPGKHWIGIHATPISDEALKSQLGLQKNRLIVVQVVPDSPAAKAGVKQHDILEKLGDQDLATMTDLIKVVNDNGDKELKLQVLRGGKTTTLVIQPAERPADSQIGAISENALQGLRLYFDDKEVDDGKGGKYIYRKFGPAIAEAKAFAFAHGGEPFPNGLSLSVSKENDQPAKIVAKKDGKTYEATEDKLGELPADIRTQVERLLSKPHAIAFSTGDLKNLHVDGAKIQAEVKKAVEAAKKQAGELRERHEGDGNTVRQRLEVRRVEGGPLDELRKEVDALRKEVQKLKGDDKKDSNDESEKNDENDKNDKNSSN